MATTNGRAADDWGEEFRRVRPLHEQFTQELGDLLTSILDRREIDRVQIERRTKAVESFVEKIRRKGEKYEDPLAEVTDLTGLRVIAYYREDLQRIDEALRSEFQVEEENFEEATRPAAPDQFGYESVHYVIRLADNRARLPEWEQFADLCAEIQVRTALQHAWAAIDHKLRYKRPRSEALPPSLQRDLFRLSALLELADKEFSALRSATAEAQESYSQRVVGGELDIPLDALSLEAYLDSTNVEDRWYERALAKGFNEPDFNSYGDPEAVQHVDREYLLVVARHVGLASVSALDEVLRKADESWGDRALDIYFEKRQNQPDRTPPIAWPTDLITILLMMKFGLQTTNVPDPQYEGDADPAHWGGMPAQGVDEAVAAFAGERD